MKALKGSAEERSLLQRYTSELNSQEDELATLKKQLADLEGKRAQSQTAFADLVYHFDFDGDI
ncbi:MAG: hypothetical protein JOZ43_06300 [Acidobacteriales bacterium]|nr:hypothetical protein [Terriglobales bacterium]